ncbi:Nicotinamide/nicotinic acid mononucleotide adenylyltransferase 1 [Branchiostoma belcheri]|nr:Nicotinamide/nicotinic acid mononucleotide adenylyltransferase 1 [Branchiostoma belcheri]
MPFDGTRMTSEAARDYLQKKGNFTVVAGIISPISHDNKKQELVSSRHRVEMCKISLQDSKWIRVDAWESTQDGHVRPLNLLRHHKTALERRFKISSPCCTQPVKNQNKPLPPPPNINKELNGKPIGWYKYGVDILQNFCCPAYLDQENQNTDDAQQIEIPKKKGITVLLLCSQEMLEAFAKPGVWRQNEESIHIVTDWIENEIIPTKVRRALRRKQSVKYLLPDGVINYIRKHKLYQTKTTDDNANVIRITDNRDITIPVDESIMPYQTDNKTFYKDNRTASKEDIDEEEEEEVKMTLEDVAVKVTAIERRVREFDMRVREVEDAVNGKFDLYNRSSFYSEESGLGDSMSEGDVDDITELTDEEEDENNTDSEKVMKWTRPSVHLGAAERLEVLLKESKEATCFSGKKDMHVHFAADVDEGFTSPTDKLHRDIHYSKDYLPKRIRKTRLDPLDKDSENRYMSLRKCRLEAALGSTDKLNNNLHFVLEPPGRAQPATCKAERSPPAEAKPNNDNVEDASGSQQLTAERKSPRYHGKISPSKEFYMWGIKFCSSESLDEEANRFVVGNVFWPQVTLSVPQQIPEKAQDVKPLASWAPFAMRRHIQGICRAWDSQEPRQQGDGQDGQTADLDPDTEKKVDTPDANKKDEATSMEKQSQLEVVQPEKKEDGVGISGIPEVRITNHSPTVEPEEEELNQISQSTGGTDKEEAEEAEKSRDIDQTTENVAAVEEEGATAEYTTEQQKKRASLKLDFSVKSPRKANSETVWHLIESDKKSFTVMVDDVDKRLTGAIGDPTWV